MALVVVAGGCTPKDRQECIASDQCDPWERCVDGQCILVEDAGSARPDAGRDGGHTLRADAGGPVDAGPHGGLCPHVDDDTLTSQELPLAMGVPIRLTESRSDGGVPVDLMGDLDPDGGTVWRLDGPLPGDHPVTMTAQPLDGYWFGSHFADGGYVAPLDGTGELLGVFRRTDTALEMLALVSREADKTRINYDPPVMVLKLPLALHDSYTSVVRASGTLDGNPFFSSTDTYQTKADARGTLVTPGGTYPVLRVRIVLDVSIPMAVWPFELNYHYVRYSFMTPCYGQVAHVASREGEQTLLFTQAAEVRRVGLPDAGARP
jgi:hypothetical protein